MPDHRMMVGITAWQQQVPIHQPYFGENAWRIPLVPVVAKNPLSAKTHFFRGAIALAANGVPIFNPIKNDGEPIPFLLANWMSSEVIAAEQMTITIILHQRICKRLLAKKIRLLTH